MKNKQFNDEKNNELLHKLTLSIETMHIIIFCALLFRLLQAKFLHNDFNTEIKSSQFERKNKYSAVAYLEDHWIFHLNSINIQQTLSIPMSAFSNFILFNNVKANRLFFLLKRANWRHFCKSNCLEKSTVQSPSVCLPTVTVSYILLLLLFISAA